MPKPSKKNYMSSTKLEELVTVTFADTAERAREYQDLLKANDIPTMIKEHYEDPDTITFAVMVPEEFFDESQVVVESQNMHDDFFDFETGDEDDQDFDFGFPDADY